MWLSALVNFLLGVVRWFWGGRQQAEGEAQGKAEQSAADAKQTVAQDRAEAKVSNEIDSKVARQSDDSLDSGLREFEASGGSGSNK